MDEEVPEIPPHLRHVKLAIEIRDWTCLLNQCVHHLKTSDTKLRLDVQAKIHQITDVWRDQFYDLSIEQGSAALSLSDLLFVLRAHMLCCDKPTLRTPIANLPEENHRLSVLLRFRLLQHRPDLVKAYPTVNEWAKLWARVARYLTQAPPVIEVPAGVTYGQDDPLSDHLNQQYIMLPTDPKNREVALKSRALGITASSGGVWLTDLKNTHLGFVKMASRLFAKVYQDRMLRTLYSTKVVEYDVDVATTRWYALVYETCAFDLGDEFAVHYHELSSEALLPIGSRDHTRRTALTQDDSCIAGALLENELGIDTCIAIQELQNRDYHPEVSENPDDLMYPWLSLNVLAHIFLNEFNVKTFFEDYWIPASGIFLKRHRLGCIHQPLCGPDRPILTILETKHIVHHYGHWVPCENMVDAILKFLYIIATVFHGTLADDTEISPLCQRMFQ